MNFRPEMRKVTHVLPREATGKATGPGYAPMGVPPMVPPKAHPMRPGYAGFTPAAHPVSHAASHPSATTTRMPGATAGFKHDPRGRRMSGEVPKVPGAPAAPAAPAGFEQSAAQPAASPRQGSKEMPKPRATPETKASDRQVRKKWEAVRERALTLLAAPAASPRNAREDGPKRRRQGRGSERPKGGGTDAEAVRDRALTLLASSNSDRIKERTKTFIQKHHVDMSLEPDELPGIPTDDCDTKPAEPDPQDDLDATLDAPTAPTAPAAPEAPEVPESTPSIERESDLPEASPEGTTFSEKPPVSKKASSPGKSSAPSPFAPPPGTPFETRDPVEETQLAQLSAGIFWILGCFFQCFFFSLRFCVCCAKSSAMNAEPKRRFNGEEVPEEAAVPSAEATEAVRPSLGFWSPTDTEKRNFVSVAAPVGPTVPLPVAAGVSGGAGVPVRRAPPRGRGGRRGKAKNNEFYDELEKLEDFFRQEAVFIGKAGSGN